MQPWIEAGFDARQGICPDMRTISDFCCILDHALAERDAGRGPLTERLGLSGMQIAQLRDRWAPHARLPDLDLPAPEAPEDQRAIGTLIALRSGLPSSEARWLTPILARRAMEPRHLWEDLGLPSRLALSDLISRILPGLAKANARNMRWKKFFYRQICADTAFSLCLSPSCEACDERSDCFASD
ncbi:nitrogen fixation protein NifQ [Tropicimonas sp. S265A]|uniref:nitrogen fixation protein NifQ n=1 Tax=Tropicimonas sp. S265A TaxID=3415134 RepID=UPI003C7DE080